MFLIAVFTGRCDITNYSLEPPLFHDLLHCHHGKGLYMLVVYVCVK